MANLLTIPRELRDNILSLVISAPSPPPKDSANDPYADKRAYFNVSNPHISWLRNSVKYTKHFNRADAIPTLLVNRQLYLETLDAISILPTKHSYLLDVIIFKDYELWPTWLHVPELVTNVDEVHAIFRCEANDPDAASKRYRWGNGGPSPFTWTFYNFLEHFLVAGPMVFRPGRTDQDFSIKNLVLEIRSPDFPPELLVSETRNTVGFVVHSSESGDTYIVCPEYLVGWLSDYIERLLHISYHTAKHGAILYERVGTITILKDGVLKQTWNLAQLLNDLKFCDSFGNLPRAQRRYAFEIWRAHAYRMRAHFKLPIITPEGGIPKAQQIKSPIINPEEVIPTDQQIELPIITPEGGIPRDQQIKSGKVKGVSHQLRTKLRGYGTLLYKWFR